MFILQSQATIEKAIERAREVHPKVHVKTFGEYEVSGSKGNTYTVRCERRCNNLKTVDCTCEAGQRGNPCYHAAVAVAQHSYMAAQQISF